MNKQFLLLPLLVALFLGCENDNTTDPPPPTTGKTFTSGNIKNTPVYFSFDAGDSVSSSANWDMKLTGKLYSPEDSLKQFPFPGIVLNPALNVLGTYVDGIAYELVDPSQVPNLKKDELDSLTTFQTGNIKYTPVYYSFDARDTVSSDQNWDIKLMRNAATEPIIILNRTKGITASVVDGIPFSNVTAAKDSTLAPDPSDTTFIIGNKCFAYNPATHTLAPYTDRTFVLRTNNGARVKFRMLEYVMNGDIRAVKFEFVAPERYSIGTLCLKYLGAAGGHNLEPYQNRNFVIQTSSSKRVKFRMLSYLRSIGEMKFEYEIK